MFVSIFLKGVTMLTTLCWLLAFAIIKHSLMITLKLPKLLCYLIAGILIGPYMFNLIDDYTLALSDE